MWTHVLRRVVRAEERQFDTRRRQQLTQAQATASSSSTAIPPVAGVAPRTSQAPSPFATASSRADKHQIVETVNSVVHTESEHRHPDHQNKDDEDDEGDGDYLQKHLLSRSTSVWSCLEDTQQANCLALNASLTLLAVGERDGRVTIWDNTTIRVITRELDPTLIAVPVMYGQSAVLTRERDAGEALTGGEQHAGLAAANELVEGKKKEKKEEEEEEEVKTLEREGIATTAGNEDSEGIGGGDEMGSGGAGLTLVDLQVVKTALKVVSQCAWSCDSQWLFAGCEEKSTRRARLCVWNVEAATLVSAFQFDGTITALSAHPLDPTLVVVSYWNSRPVLLDVVSGKRIVLENVPLENEEMPQSTPQSNSKHPMLASCARYGRSGKRIYCATSKSTLAVLDAATLQCLDSLKLNVIVQFVDLCVNLRETAMLLTSSKGIHEFAMDSTTATGTSQHARDAVCTGAMEHPIGVREVALHSTGAVRAPWAVCCFSGGEEFVVGTPVVRHRHVGENGLFTWHRASKIGRTAAQHNTGVKDGVLALAWDRMRQSVLAVSTSGALHVLEEQFTTTWPGAMYPAGFRLITDNEVHLDVFDRDAEERKREKEELTKVAKRSPVDVFTVKSPSSEFPSECAMADSETSATKLCYIPAIPIEHYHRQHLHQLHGGGHNEDNDFGLGQSVFEPLKSALVEQEKKNARKSRSGVGTVQKRRRK